VAPRFLRRSGLHANALPPANSKRGTFAQPPQGKSHCDERRHWDVPAGTPVEQGPRSRAVKRSDPQGEAHDGPSNPSEGAATPRELRCSVTTPTPRQPHAKGATLHRESPLFLAYRENALSP
jgi:hypothetical protein